MRTARAVLLAIVATLALAGGFASTADAGGGGHRNAPASVDGPGGPYDETTNPGDPEVPPGP